MPAQPATDVPARAGRRGSRRNGKSAPPPAAAPLLPLVADVVPEARNRRVADSSNPRGPWTIDLTLRSPRARPLTGADQRTKRDRDESAALRRSRLPKPDDEQRLERARDAAIARRQRELSRSGSAESQLRAEPTPALMPKCASSRLSRLEHPVSFGVARAARARRVRPSGRSRWRCCVGVALGFAGGYWLGQSDRRARADSGVGRRCDRRPRPKCGSRPTRRLARGPPRRSVARPRRRPRRRPHRRRVRRPRLWPNRHRWHQRRAPDAAPPQAPRPVSKPAETAAVARTGRITVRTTPAGARVTIDGRDVGKAPLTIPNLGARHAHGARHARRIHAGRAPRGDHRGPADARR